VLVGHSRGCRIALEVFSQQSAKVTRIVLLDGSWYGPAPTKDYKPASRSDAEELQNVLHVFDTMMGPATSEEFRQQIQRHLRHIDLGYAGQLRKDYIAWDGERMEEALGLVGSANGEVRVLVVQGTEGHGSKRKGLKRGEEGEWMKVVKGKVGERYTGLVVEGTGHWPHVDKVQEVVDAVESFGMGVLKFKQIPGAWNMLRFKSA
jgi:pimeloyl-ACP methyl ester carboxylesterase